MPPYHPFMGKDDQGKNLMTIEEMKALILWLRNPQLEPVE